jgi:hypothetical protein
LARVEVLATCSNRKNGTLSRWKNSVIVLCLKSGRTVLLHDVSKKDLNLGLSENLFGSIMWTSDKGADYERSRIWPGITETFLISVFASAVRAAYDGTRSISGSLRSTVQAISVDCVYDT